MQGVFCEIIPVNVEEIVLKTIATNSGYCFIFQ